MAERGAHVTGAYLGGPVPSLFEVVSQQSLADTCQPAFTRILQFLATRNPEKFACLIAWSDEIFLAINALLQNHYLKHHGGSFAETFYSLRRVSLSGEPLSQRQRLLALQALVLFPYLRTKLEKTSSRLRIEEADGVSLPRRWSRASRSMLVHLHNVLHALWEGLTLVQLVAYLTRHSPFHSPLMWCLRQTLQYALPEVEVDHWENIWDGAAFPASWFSFRNIRSSLFRVLEVGVFFLQFLQWWQAEQLHTSLTALPVPPAPKVSACAGEVAQKCPICKRPWKIETVLAVSGYVFCYCCIVRHLQKEGCCPVTRYPASINDLIRVYS